MINQSTYIVMGDDGNEYGPVSAEQVREWIRENRLERKTPVKPNTAKDWMFLEMLPEFQAALSSISTRETAGRPSRKWLWLLVLLALAAVVLLALKKYNHL